MIRKRLKYWLYGNCPGFAGSFPYYGTKVHFPKNSISFRAACEQGIFEADNVRLLQSLVKPNTTYFDVGANIGLMSVPILQGCSNCMVVSFEPSPNTVAYLQRTASESSFKNRWVIIQRALSDTQGRAEFHLAAKELSMFDGLRDTRRVTVARTVTVEVSTLDKEWDTLGRPVVSVIKCDVEGNELASSHGRRVSSPARSALRPCGMESGQPTSLRIRSNRNPHLWSYQWLSAFCVAADNRSFFTS